MDYYAHSPAISEACWEIKALPALCYTVELSQCLNKHSLISKVSPSVRPATPHLRMERWGLPTREFFFTNHTSWCILVNFPIIYVIRKENLVNISPCYMSAILWRTFVPYLFLSRVMWRKLLTPQSKAGNRQWHTKVTVSTVKLLHLQVKGIPSSKLEIPSELSMAHHCRRGCDYQPLLRVHEQVTAAGGGALQYC